MNIVGQEQVLSLINSFTIDTLPSTMMLVGETGSGRHLICEYIAEKFGLVLEDITVVKQDIEKSKSVKTTDSDDSTKTISKSDSIKVNFKEYIAKMYEETVPHLYIINGDLLASRNRGDMNALLKIFEDPIPGSFSIFLCETTSNVLETICNRCFIMTLKHYTDAVLGSFLSDGDAAVTVRIARTPGQIISFRGYNIMEMIQYADNMLDKIKGANYANILNISDKKISYDGDKTKYDLTQFILVILYSIWRKYTVSNMSQYLGAYGLTTELYRNSKIFNINTKALFEKYLMDLRQIMR